MSETLQPVIVLIGECDSPQFCGTVLNVRPEIRFLGSPQTHRVKSIHEAIEAINRGELIPELVIVYQSIPDEYLAADIDRLIGLLPLSRFVVAFSPWCESIGRTEQRWPSAWSVPVAQAAARIRSELQQWTNRSPPLPATTSRDEAFATLAAGSLACAEKHGRELSAKAYCDDTTLRECFEAILASCQFTTDSDSPNVCVVVAAFIDQIQLARVQELSDRTMERWGADLDSPQPQIIVASDMATPGDVIALKNAGATAVISQLRFAEDLVDLFSSRLVQD